MAKKKTAKKISKTLKDFDIVSHIINVEPKDLIGEKYKYYQVHAIYINKYGLEVGYLVYNSGSEQYYSWDINILQEYNDLKEQTEKSLKL